MGTTFEYVDGERNFVAIVSNDILDGFREGDIVSFHNLAGHGRDISREVLDALPRTGRYVVKRRVPHHEQFSDGASDNKFDMRYIAERLE